MTGKEIGSEHITRQFVYTATPGYELSCAPELFALSDRELFCTWMSGGRTEPSNKNCVLISRSADVGRTWSKADVLFDKPGLTTIGSVGPLDPETGRLHGSMSTCLAENSYCDLTTYRLYSDDRGRTWSKPEMHERSNEAQAMLKEKKPMGPIVSSQPHIDRRGAWVLDDGTLVNLVGYTRRRKTPVAGVTDKPFYTHQWGVATSWSEDDGKTWYLSNRVENYPLGLLEPSLIQLKDGRLIILMRAEFDGRLWRAESSDRGRTWTEAWPTGIPNPSSNFWLGRLKDGRIALVNNPASCGVDPLRMGPRDPLELWLSEDEMETWPVRVQLDRYENYRPLAEPGARHYEAAVGWLSYPCCREIGESLLCVYDLARRDVVLITVQLNG